MKKELILTLLVRRSGSATLVFTQNTPSHTSYLEHSSVLFDGLPTQNSNKESPRAFPGAARHKTLGAVLEKEAKTLNKTAVMRESRITAVLFSIA